MPPRLDENEAREILEDLARNGPPTAKVAAIRLLLKLDADDEEPQPDVFELLDAATFGPEEAARRRALAEEPQVMDESTEPIYANEFGVSHSEDVRIIVELRRRSSVTITR